MSFRARTRRVRGSRAASFLLAPSALAASHPATASQPVQTAGTKLR